MSSVVRFLFVLIGVLCVLARWTSLPDRLGYAGSSVLLYRDGSPAHVFLSSDHKWRIPAVQEEVDPHYLQALLSLEDERFYLHPGVDGLAVARAAAGNMAAGKVVSGASTLTMQLVRMLEPRPRIFR